MKSDSILDTVPNEILDCIFCHLPTSSLLSLVRVNRRVRAVTLHVLKQRLTRAVSAPDRRVMLECYHPAEKLYAPYLYCDFVRADPFTNRRPGRGNGSDVGCLVGTYAHFRPVESDETRSWAKRRCALWGGEWEDGDRGGGGNGGDGDRDDQESQPHVDVYLDDDESLSQLCTITNIVRPGPKPGLFRSHVNISDGVVRVWRDWLGARARAAAARGGGERRGAEPIGDSREDQEVVLWADPHRNVGVRFRVTEKDIRRKHPVLVTNDEQLPVAYRLEFEELLVKTTTLLVMTEKSEMQEFSPERKAVVCWFF
ncbi:hypothetical protein VTH82DRAFT_4650 [Thermothelomyces myriococcoides]